MYPIAIKYTKKSNSDTHLTSYIKLQDEYRKKLKKAKLVYEQKLLCNLSHVKNNGQFWDTVRIFNIKKEFFNVIDTKTRDEFYYKIYPPRENIKGSFMSVLHSYLDAEFSFPELTSFLKKCKNNKASGMDGISNLKSLPPQWKYYPLNVFNEVLGSEKIPNSLSMIDIRMLHAK